MEQQEQIRVIERLLRHRDEGTKALGMPPLQVISN